MISWCCESTCGRLANVNSPETRDYHDITNNSELCLKIFSFSNYKTNSFLLYLHDSWFPSALYQWHPIQQLVSDHRWRSVHNPKLKSIGGCSLKTVNTLYTYNLNYAYNLDYEQLQSDRTNAKDVLNESLSYRKFPCSYRHSTWWPVFRMRLFRPKTMERHLIFGFITSTARISRSMYRFRYIFSISRINVHLG